MRTAQFLLLLGGWSSSHALAGLGQSVHELQMTTQRTATALNASYHTTYTRFEYKNPQGIRLHEFSDPVTGKIFAVTWQGQRPYPLRQAMGKTTVILPAHSGYDHHRYLYHDAHLVVESHMYLHQFYGRVYLPDQLPAQMLPQDIQ